MHPFGSDPIKRSHSPIDASTDGCVGSSIDGAVDSSIDGSAGRGRRWRRIGLRTLAICLSVALALPASTMRAQGSSGTALDLNLPRLGDAGNDELSPAQERRLGEAVIRQMRREGDVLDDAEATEWLNRFAAPLADSPRARGFSFEFFLVNDATLNAFALPGGYIGVHTGLIMAAESEAELASVLGHEMGHVIQRHIARMLSQQRQGSMLQLAALVLGALAARSNPSAAMGAIMMGGGAAQQMMLSFSRDAEREADRTGIDILRDARYDPNGMVSFFNRLQLATRAYDSNAPSYLRTHPMTTERIADMQARIREQRYVQRPDSVDFGLIRAKFRALTDPGVDGLRLARGQFERQLRDKTTGNEAANWYGIAVAALAQRDFAGADKALAEARSRIKSPDVLLDRLAVDIRLQSGDVERALALCGEALKRFPQSRALAYLQAESLTRGGRSAQAIKFLEDEVALYRDDPNLWRLLAQAYGDAGRTADAHRASAERYALMGGWMAAIEQLRMARKSNTLDFYVASQVDSRIQDFQAQYTIEQEERKSR